jgi:hypothetical protein
MPNYRHEGLPNSPVASNPNARPNYARLDAAAAARERHGPAWDSDDPYVRWQYLVDNRPIGGNRTPHRRMAAIKQRLSTPPTSAAGKSRSACGMTDRRGTDAGSAGWRRAQHAEVGNRGGT